MGLLSSIQPKLDVAHLIPSTNVEQRVTLFPRYGGKSIDNPANALSDVFDDALGDTGVSSTLRVNHSTSLGIATLYACTKIISEDIATAQVEVQTFEDGCWTTDYDHYLNDFLISPSAHHSWMDVSEAITGNATLSGNGVGHLVKSRTTGRPIAVEVADYTEVAIYRDLHNPRKLWYHLSGQGMPTLVLRSDEVIHIKAFSLNGLVGISHITHAANTYATAMYAQGYVNQTYAEGGYGGGVITSPLDMGDPARAKISRYVTDMQRRGKFPVLDEGMEFTPNKISPQDIAYISTMKNVKEEISSMHRVPLALLQDRDLKGSYQTKETVTTHIKFCLNAWATRWEYELRRKAVMARDKRILRFNWNFDGLLRGDYAARAEYITKMMTAQVMTKNEGRKIINLAPDPHGDTYVDFQKSAAIDKENIHTKTVAAATSNNKGDEEE